MSIGLLEQRINAQIKILEANGLESYDPYDGLNSQISLFICFGNQFLSRVIQQLVFRAPINLRPLFGVKKIVHTKAVSDLVSAFAILYSATKNQEYRRLCYAYLNVLENLAFETKDGKAWGLRFPFATRFVKADSNVPNIFQTVNALNALLDVYEFVENSYSLESVHSAIRYIKTVFGYEENEDYVFWKYWRNLDQEIFNVSGLMLGVLSRIVVITGDGESLRLLRKTHAYLRMRQNVDGSWYYAFGDRAKFIDGFHTGYILEGQMRAILAGLSNIDESFIKGANFFVNNFFTENNTPKYFHNKAGCFDIQNAAQAIQTLVYLSRLNIVPVTQAEAVFNRTDEALWNKRGYYDFRKSPGCLYSTPMHRWATGPMLLAQSNLLLTIKNNRNGCIIPPKTKSL